MGCPSLDFVARRASATSSSLVQRSTASKMRRPRPGSVKGVATTSTQAFKFTSISVGIKTSLNVGRVVQTV